MLPPRSLPLLVVCLFAQLANGQENTKDYFGFLSADPTPTIPIDPRSVSLTVRPNQPQSLKAFIYSSRQDDVIDMELKVVVGNQVIAKGKATAKKKSVTFVPLEKVAEAQPLAAGQSLVITIVVEQPNVAESDVSSNTILMAKRPGADYASSVKARFNQIEKIIDVDVQGFDFTGQPVPIELDLSRIGGLKQPVEGATKVVMRSKQNVELSAGPLQFGSQPPAGSVATLTIDGVPRSVVFDGRLQANVLDPYQPRPPEVRVRGDNVYAPVYLKKADAKKANLVGEVYSVDPDSVRQFEISVGRTGPLGTFQKSRRFGFDADRQIGFSFTPPSPDGSIGFQVNVNDPTVEVDLDGMLGRFEARAEMIYIENGVERTVSSKDPLVLVIDNTPPLIQLKDPKSPIGKGEPLVLAAEVVDPESGVDKVTFDVDGKKFPASRVSDKEFNIRLPLPNDKLIAMQVSVDATNRAGMTDTVTKPVFVVERIGDAGQPGADEPLGKIQGTVTRAGLAQPNKTVFLFDEAGKVVRQTNTNDKGEFQFDKLKPGNYSLACENRAFGHVASFLVQVRAKETAKADLKLKQP